MVFVSNVAGSPKDKDGRGWISTFTVDGNVVSSQWITGLNAPKGQRVHDGTLWVSDIDEMVAIDINEGKINKKIEFPEADFLNDVAIDTEGTVYVSDMFANKIYLIRGEETAVFASGDHLESPNGLLVHEQKLIVAGWGNKGEKGRLYFLDLKTNEKTNISEPLGNLDGLELDTNGGFLVSDWVAGKVYKIGVDGKAQLLLYGFEGAADLGFVRDKKLLILPRMKEDMLTAFELEKYPH